MAIDLQEKKLQLAKHRKKILVFFLCLVVGILLLFIYNLRRYDDYDAKESYDRVDSSATHYLDYQGNILKYSRDGAFYTAYNGELIWNYTYEMSNPKSDVCDNYVLIYDLHGTQAAILSNNGFVKSIKTSMPIVDAAVASQGTIAILMQDGETGYVQLINADGDILASGELHTKNSGYPMAIALSSTAERLMVSQLDIKDGSVKTTLAFYDFGSVGKDKIDNVIATYSFADQIFPEIAYVDGDKAIAFGDTEVVTFNGNSKASIEKEVFLDGTIEKVFYDDKYWGVICQTTDENGEYINQMSVYTMAGMRRMQKTIDFSCTNVEFLSNHEILLTDYTEVELYTLAGIKKFSYEFNENIYKIIPQDSARRYVFIEDGKTEVVRIK